ncbi:hypothetical protein GF420_01060 [candidate division GN15 bacterium]|nr:hypothetical protein [candidate division GN15 bacterium]
MRTHLLWLLCALLILSLVTCTSKSTDPTIPDDGMYPDAVGSRFVFVNTQDSDSTRPPDTSVIEITAKWTDSTGALIVHFEYPDILGKGGYTARIYGDTVDIKQDNNPTDQPNFRILFPLEVGRQWTVPGPDLVVSVDSCDQVETPAGTFRKAYLLHYEINAIGGSMVIELWIAPGVGMVREDHWTSMVVYPPAEETHSVTELVTYSIPNDD